MASQTQVAASYSSVARSGDHGNTWTLGGTLNVADTNYAVQIPFNSSDGGFSTPFLGIPASILRVLFAAFSLPPTDTIVSAMVHVQHKQGSLLIDPGGSLIFENNGNTLSSTSDITETVSIDVSTLTIAALNAATQPIDLKYHGSGSISSPLINGTPEVFVNFVSLTVNTAASVTFPTVPILENHLTVVPSTSIKVMQ